MHVINVPFAAGQVRGGGVGGFGRRGGLRLLGKGGEGGKRSEQEEKRGEEWFHRVIKYRGED
jgi:hypothetical protein